MTTLIPEGSYRARAGAAALGTAKTGTEQVAVEIILLEGPGAGSRLTWYGYFNSDANIERAVESLRLLGWQGNDLDALDGLGSTEVFAVIGHEEYNGEWRARVKWINDMGGVALSHRFDAHQARSFAARMKGKVLSLGGSTQRPTAPAGGASGPAVNPPSSDDIPF